MNPTNTTTAMNETGLIRGEIIWDLSRMPDRENTRLEFPALIRFQHAWYCAFREGEIHNNHPSGRVRLIRSHDGERWDTVRLFDWDCGDVREPKFAITAEGHLMINTSVYFVSREPRWGPARKTAANTSCLRQPPANLEQPTAAPADLSYTPPEARRAEDQPNAYYQLDWLGTVLNLPDDDAEPRVTQQTVTWLSADGKTWSSAYACPTGINTWRWDVTWHNGMGYSIAQWGKDSAGTLYRTRDGKSWRALTKNFFPKGHAGEGALDFGPDGTACCLLRGDSQAKVFIGVGKAPYYQDWTWHTPEVDYGPAHGGTRPATEVLGTGLGGPKLLRLRDGRMVGAGRALGPGRDDGHATLFWIDPDRCRLTLFAEMDGTSYPGLAEHDGCVWVTCVGSACHQNVWEVKLGKVPLPSHPNNGQKSPR